MERDFEDLDWTDELEDRRHKRGKGQDAAASLNEHQQLQVEYARTVARAEQQELQAHTLFALSHCVSVTLELDELRQAIVESLHEALRADTTSLFLREADGSLRMVAQRNIDLTHARILFGPEEGLAALAARERRVIHVPDTTSHADYLSTGHDHPRSLLAVPVDPHSGASYVLCVVRRRVYAFTEDEVQFAHLMASVAAQALSNAALFREMSLLAREQTTLYELARASSISDGITSFIGRAVEPLRRALGATGCGIMLVPKDEVVTPARHALASHNLSQHGLDLCEAFVEELAATAHAKNVALRCDVSPDGSRLVVAPVVARDEPVAIVAWEMLVGGSGAHKQPNTLPVHEVWNATHHLSEDAATITAPPVLTPPLPLSEVEATFIASVSQQLALGIENLRLRSRDLSALRSISALPASRPHLNELRQAIVAEIAEAFAPAGVALILSDENTAEGTAPSQWRVAATSPNVSPSWLRAAVHLAEQSDPHDAHQARGIALAPLVADHETFGWLALRLVGTARLTSDRTLLLTSLASTAALLLRNARLHLMAREAAVDRERQRIAREIHDGVAQNLAHLMLRLELVNRLIPSNPVKAQGEAEASRKVLLSSLNDLRQSIAAMAPAQLEELGFVGALQALLDDIATNTPDLDVTFTSCPDDAIALELRAPAFRVVQEALANIRKHARAQHAWIAVEITDRAALQVTIRDDGLGFTPDPAATTKGHFGLRGMRDRAIEFGGDLAITSVPGQGTTVLLTLPLALAA